MNQQFLCNDCVTYIYMLYDTFSNKNVKINKIMLFYILRKSIISLKLIEHPRSHNNMSKHLMKRE